MRPQLRELKELYKHHRRLMQEFEQDEQDRTLTTEFHGKNLRETYRSTSVVAFHPSQHAEDQNVLNTILAEVRRISQTVSREMDVFRVQLGSIQGQSHHVLEGHQLSQVRDFINAAVWENLQVSQSSNEQSFPADRPNQYDTYTHFQNFEKQIGDLTKMYTYLQNFQKQFEDLAKTHSHLQDQVKDLTETYQPLKEQVKDLTKTYPHLPQLVDRLQEQIENLTRMSTLWQKLLEEFTKSREITKSELSALRPGSMMAHESSISQAGSRTGDQPELGSDERGENVNDDAKDEDEDDGSASVGSRPSSGSILSGGS